MGLIKEGNFDVRSIKKGFDFFGKSVLNLVIDLAV